MKASCAKDRYNIGKVAFLLLILCFLAMMIGCEPREQPPKEGEMALLVLSPAFQEGGKIPTKYTCQGQDVSLPLTWGDPPPGIGSFSLIVDDLDAPGGVFTHWILFNIPADSRELPEAVPAQAQLASGTLQGKNGFGRLGYGGPCPPPGRPHRYRFTLYALDQPLDLKAGSSRKLVADSMKGHVIAQGQLTGTYQR